MNHEPPLVYPQDGSKPHYVGGFKDLKIGDVYTICGMAPRRVVEGPEKSERGGWRIRSEPAVLPSPTVRPAAAKGPLVFPANGAEPFRRGSPSEIQVGDIYAIGSEPTRLAVGVPEFTGRGWKIPSKPAMPQGFIADSRGGVRTWRITTDAALLLDSGVAALVDLGENLCTVKGTFGFSTLLEQEPVTLSPTFRLATKAGAVFLAMEEAQQFLEAAIGILNKRYRMTTIASYLSITEEVWKCIPSNLLELRKRHITTMAALRKAHGTRDSR
ncbi:MAG: hypothetical protein H6827_09790 [Planctomycetes bacterium]|nr:hypothetical protein [Planctomycetota bacterium]